jgi:WD40 repeat protein
VSPDGQRFAMAGVSRLLGVFALGEEAPQAEVENRWGRPTRLAFTPEGDQVLIGGGDQHVHRVRLADGEELKAYGMHLGQVMGVAVARQGRVVITISAVTRDGRTAFDNQVRVFDTAKGTYVASVPLSVSPTCLRVSGDQTTFAVGNERGEVLIGDQYAGKLVGSLPAPKDAGSVTAVAFSPDRKTVYAAYEGLGSAGACLRAWELDAERLTHERILGATPTSLALGAGGRTLLVGTRAGRVELWDVSALAPVGG